MQTTGRNSPFHDCPPYRSSGTDQSYGGRGHSSRRIQEIPGLPCTSSTSLPLVWGCFSGLLHCLHALSAVWHGPPAKSGLIILQMRMEPTNTVLMCMVQTCTVPTHTAPTCTAPAHIAPTHTAPRCRDTVMCEGMCIDM